MVILLPSADIKERVIEPGPRAAGVWGRGDQLGLAGGERSPGGLGALALPAGWPPRRNAERSVAKHLRTIKGKIYDEGTKCATFVLPGVPIKLLFDRLVGLWFAPGSAVLLPAALRPVVCGLEINYLPARDKQGFPLPSLVAFAIILEKRSPFFSFPATHTDGLLKGGDGRIQICCIHLNSPLLLQPAAANLAFSALPIYNRLEGWAPLL